MISEKSCDNKDWRRLLYFWSNKCILGEQKRPKFHIFLQLCV